MDTTTATDTAGSPPVNPRTRRIDAGPLVAAVEALPELPSRTLPHMDRLIRSYYRARRDGDVTMQAADEICTLLLDRHPCEVYGPVWWDPPGA